MKLIAFTFTISCFLITKNAFIKREACRFFLGFVRNRVVYSKGQICCYADCTLNSKRIRERSPEELVYVFEHTSSIILEYFSHFVLFFRSLSRCIIRHIGKDTVHLIHFQSEPIEVVN